jgi:hypothetical protein
MIYKLLLSQFYINLNKIGLSIYQIIYYCLNFTSSVDICWIVNNFFLEVVVRFVDIGGTVDHLCLASSVDIGRIPDNFWFQVFVKQRWSTVPPISTKRTTTSKKKLLTIQPISTELATIAVISWIQFLEQ